MWNHLPKGCIFFYKSCFVLDRGGPLCFRYICKLIALYPCRLLPCPVLLVHTGSDRKLDTEKVLGMRLHNYMVYSQCMGGLIQVPPHNLHALFLAYLQHVSMVYIITVPCSFWLCTMFQGGSSEAIQITTTAQDMADLPPEHTSVWRHCTQSLWHCPHRDPAPP